MNKHSGFTLIELLMVIAIVSLLSSITLGPLQDAREKSRIAAGQKFSSSLHHAIGDQLVGEWKFDNSLVDTSGFGNDATPGGAVVYGSSVTGQGASLSFTRGANQWVNVPDTQGVLDIGDRDSYTVSFWYYLDSSVDTSPDESVSEHWEVGGGYPWAIRGPYGSGGLNFIIYDGTCGACCGVSVGTNKNVVDSKWHHYAFVRDFDKKMLFLYIDGKKVNERSTIVGGCPVDEYDDVSTNGYGFAIGARQQIGNYQSTGMIDDFRVYNRAFNGE